jgi:hypothetical protein
MPSAPDPPDDVGEQTEDEDVEQAGAEALHLRDELRERTEEVRSERATVAGIDPGLSPHDQHEERHRRAHEGAAVVHERAAALHEDAAVFFEAHDRPEQAAREADSAARERDEARDARDEAEAGP